MPLNLNSMLIGSENPQALVEFYNQVFDKKPDMDDGGYSGWQVGNFFIGVGPHSEVHGQSKEPGRLIYSLETADVKGEFDRIKATGAAVIKEPYQMEGNPMWIATFADPDGNYFQLMSPWESDK